MADRKLIFDRLFIAVPEIVFDPQVISRLLEDRLLSEEQAEKVRRYREQHTRAYIVAHRLRGKSLLERLFIVAPELVSVSTTNFLRYLGVITEAQGHKMRIVSRMMEEVTKGGATNLSAEVMLKRLLRAANVGASFETIDLLRAMDRISVEEAEIFRQALTLSRSLERVQKNLTRSQGMHLLHRVMLVAPELLEPSTIRAMALAEIVGPRTAALITQTLELGLVTWKVFEGAKAADGMRARALLVADAVFTPRMVNLLLRNEIITAAQARMLRQAIETSALIRKELEDDAVEKRRRYRIKPGEAPIKSFARASRWADDQILRLLAVAAEEAKREAAELAAKKGVGAGIRSSQYRVAVKALHDSMHRMWEGVGYLTIFGEQEAAAAATEAMDSIQRKLWNKTTAGQRAMIMGQARAGVDAFISRQEFTNPLSRRVYKNLAFYNKKIDDRINIGLLQGKSAREIANDVFKFVSPRTPGGASYAAMRLARTEINSAFHTTSIRFTRDQPWVTGYRWHLSGSHSRPDTCNDYAGDDHDGLGAGVFKKSNVPGKPHPQCLCYITTEVVSADRFFTQYRKGAYNKYLDDVAGGAVYS